MFNNLINNIQNKINNIKEENANYNNLLNNSSKFSNLTPIPILNQSIIESKINYITKICPDLNKEKATIINKLIPLQETYLTINYSKEIITNTEYWLVATDKYLWTINQKNYGVISYKNIKTCNIVKNNIMSKIINLNNIILEINGNTENITNFINILSNEQYRNKKINEKTSYLCGITPIYQLINSINSGISIDKNNNIVFHSNTFNYKYTPQEIINYELLLDNTYITGKNNNQKNNITSMQNTCYTISLRITTPNTTFIIPILEQNSMGTKYTRQDSIFQKSMNFAKEIINKLNELDKQN